MFVLGNFVEAVAVILDKALQLYTFVLFVAVLVSWVHPDPFNPIVRILRMATEPLLEWVRRHLPFTMVGMVDLSPMVLFLLIWFLRIFLIRSLFDLSSRLR